MNKEKKWLRGFFDESKYGFRLKLHKDAIKSIIDGDFKPVGDFYQIEIGKRRDGNGYFLAEDHWVPTKQQDKKDKSNELPF